MTQILSRVFDGVDLDPSSSPEEFLSAVKQVGGGSVEKGINLLSADGGIFRDAGAAKNVLTEIANNPHGHGDTLGEIFKGNWAGTGKSAGDMLVTVEGGSLAGIVTKVVTQVIIKMSNTFERYFWIGMILILAMVFFIQFSKKKIWYKKAKASFWLRVPFVGEFIRKVKIAQFTQAINLLTGSKIPLLNALELTRQMIDYYPLQHALLKVESDILKGKTLYESIKDIPIFDKRMSSLIKVAEETNQNETIFKRLTDQYNEEVEYKSKMISATIEPFVVLILGIIVATVLIAMYLPMFKMSAVIG